MKKLQEVLKRMNEFDASGYDESIDEIGDFWVVTEPTKDSTLGDVCFQTTIWNIYLSFRGGLDPDKMVLITQDERKAKQKANALMQAVR